MSNLDPRIELIREKYHLDRSDFWELPQKKGTWLVKHAALEVAASKAGIRFDDPIIVEADTANGIAVVSVSGRMLNKPGTDLYGPPQWSLGEASPKNNKNAYPWAMAEKRAKDRVILKLIGIHGLVYSEDEMSDPEPAPKVLVKDQREIDADLRAEINACATAEELERLKRTELFKTEFRKLKPDWQEALIEMFNEALADRQAAPAVTPRGYVEPVFPQQ